MKARIILIPFSLLLAMPNFIDKDINGVPVYNKIERFDPRLSSLNSIDKLDQYVDAEAAAKSISVYSEKYTTMLAYIISCRFYHGFSHFSLSENWIAAVSEKVFGYGLASKVNPDDIMKHKYAACSQQAIVMMAVLRKKNISYRKVGFPHHYALEARINNNWYLFDPNMEPAISLRERLHETWNGSNDHLKKYYTKHGNVNWEFGTHEEAQYGIENEVPGRHAEAFQHLTCILSKIVWCFPVIFLLMIRSRQSVLYAGKQRASFPQRKNLRPVSALKYYF